MRGWLTILAALIASPAWAGLIVGSPSGGTIPDDVTLPVSSTPVGAVAADAFAGWTNLATSVSQNSDYTSPTTTIRYITRPSADMIIATTVGEWRDVEVTTYATNGCAVLRYQDGVAVTFKHNVATHYFGVNIERGITPGIHVGNECLNHAATSGSTRLYETLDPAADIPGYSSTATQNDTFTFGCAGWSCYAEYNGVEFWNSGADIRIPMEAGAVAVSGSAVRQTSVDWLPLETIYSIPAASIYDMRDFGFRSVETTGSITSGSNELTVASSAGYAVGDDIIVECGTEAGACARNTVGVGGVWPAAHYANDAAMDAAVPCTASSYAYLEDTGKVRQCNANGANWYAWDVNLYYTNTMMPRALSATITEINGNVLTLDTAASATATNANIYLDSSQYFDMFGNSTGNSVFTPVGTYRFAERTVWQTPNSMYLNNGVTIQGAGLDKENPVYTFYSPYGAVPASLAIYDSDNITVDGVFIKSNGGADKYGLFWTASGVTNTTVSVGVTVSVCNGISIVDSGAEDTLGAAVAYSFCNNSNMTRPYARVTYYPITYVGSWKINYSDSTGGTVTDAEVDSDWLINGFELFRSDGVQAHGFTGRNSLVSSNSSGGGWLWEDFVLDFDEDSANYPLRYGALDGFILSVNSNIQPPNPSMQEGGTIRNPTVNLEYLILSTHFLPTVIVVNENNPNITIEGTYPTCSSPKGLISTPGWFSGTNTFYGIGVGTTGDNTIVSGIRFIGDADYSGGKGNVSAGQGVTTRTATITNNVMDHAATGTFVKTETGTITNSAYEALCP